MFTPILAWLDSFETPAVPWAEHDWLAPLGFQMAAQSGGASVFIKMVGGNFRLAGRGGLVS